VLDRTPEAAIDEATRTLDRWSAFTDAFAPWLDAHPVPQTPTALEETLLPILPRPAAGCLSLRIICTPLPLVSLEDPL